MLRTLVVGFSLLCLVAANAHARPFTEEERARIRKIADDYRKHMHWSAKSVDIEGAIAHIEKRAQTETGTVDVGPWLQEALTVSWWSWLPKRPQPQYETLYGMPLDVRTPRIVREAKEEGAVTFLAASGARVYAARSGRVARVVDGFVKCCLAPEDAFRTNFAMVLHEDGTVATYSQLRSGVRVKQDEWVERGELIGYASRTGPTETPGLVFGVWVPEKGNTRSLAIRFEDETGEAQQLAAGETLERPVEQQLRLGFWMDGQQVRRRAKPRQVKVGERLKLRLRHLKDRANQTDVTNSPKTVFDTPTPWLVKLTHGAVEFRREQWPGTPEGRQPVVRALYQDRDTGKTGSIDIEFELVD